MWMVVRLSWPCEECYQNAGSGLAQQTNNREGRLERAKLNNSQVKGKDL